MKLTLVAVPLIDEIEGQKFAIDMDKVKTCPPYGLYLLHNIVRHAGYECDICDLICEGAIDEEQLLAAVRTSDVIGLATTSLNWPAVLDCVRTVRRHSPSIPILLGGVHASTYWSYILERFPVNYVLRGEADRSLVSFLEFIAGKRRVNEVPGLCYRSDGIIARTPQTVPLSGEQLADLPMPSFDQVPPGHYEGLGVESSRGCGYSCAFCSTVSRGNWRALAPDRFIERAKRITEFVPRTRHKVLQIIDDCFTLDVRRAIAILDLWRQELHDYPITLDARADNMRDPRLVKALRGIINHLLIGAECGYEEGLKRVRKGTTLIDLEESARLACENGISEACVYSFIVGFPWENYDDCMRTISFAANLKLRYDVRLYVQWFNTIPGSYLWNELKRERRVDISQYDKYGFFRNDRLFYAGVRLSPEEIARVSQAISAINKLLVMVKSNGDLIEFTNPLAVLDGTYSAPEMVGAN
jgi:anaerobic magnesium-protoporphyrin IX monomethyl ester cyclase